MHFCNKIFEFHTFWEKSVEFHAFLWRNHWIQFIFFHRILLLLLHQCSAASSGREVSGVIGQPVSILLPLPLTIPSSTNLIFWVWTPCKIANNSPPYVIVFEVGIPCDLTPPSLGDSPHLILWYKNIFGSPIYRSAFLHPYQNHPTKWTQ